MTSVVSKNIDRFFPIRFFAKPPTTRTCTLKVFKEIEVERKTSAAVCFEVFTKVFYEPESSRIRGKKIKLNMVFTIRISASGPPVIPTIGDS